MPRLIGVLTIAGALLLVPGAGASGLEHGGCRPGQAPQFRPEFGPLKERLGAAMGDPVGCEAAVPATGDLAQRTTTGLAYRLARTGAPAFSDGRAFWALTAGGLEAWAGNWHAGSVPPSMAAAPDLEVDPPDPAPTEPLVSAEVVTIVEVLDPARGALVVRRGAGLYRIEAGADCAPPGRVAGQVVAVLSPAAFAGDGSRVAWLGGGGDCAIAAGREL